MKKFFLSFLFFVFLSFLFFVLRPLFKQGISEIKTPLGQTNFPLVLPTPPPRITTLAFAGEMIFARTVAQKINEYRDYKYPFSKVEPILKKADLRFATLEAPLFGKNVPCPSGCMVFVGDEGNVEGLIFGGVNIVSLANNHIMDAGEKGLEKTIEILADNNISFIGAGLNLTSARQPIIENINGLKFGFLGYNNIPPQQYGAQDNKSGSAWIEEDYLVEDIKNLKPLVDIIIVSFHWGTEYTEKPNEEQKFFAHLAIDNGADLIIGDHPHWIQSIEFYKDRPIFYSVGNFIFDQMWSEETRKGIMVFVTYREKILEKIEIIPFRIFDYVQPIPMEGQEKEKMISYILSISEKESANKLTNFLEK